MRANQEILSKLHAEDRQLTEDRMRYTLRLEKFTKDLEEMKKNTGKPEYFLQFNQAAHYYVEQMILEQSSKEAHQEMRAGGEPDPDRMTYEVIWSLTVATSGAGGEDWKGVQRPHSGGIGGSEKNGIRTPQRRESRSVQLLLEP